MLIGITYTIYSDKDRVIELLKNDHNFEDGETEFTKWKAELKDEEKRDKKNPELLLGMVKMNYERKYMIEIKTEEELHEYRKSILFLLLAVDSALSPRYENWVRDNRNNQKENVKIDVSEFMKKIDNDNKEKYKIMSVADFTVSTDHKSNDELKQEISKILKNPLRSLKEDYFMYLAEVTASRTNCMSRKVGCILVKDDYRVIATGYNGAPKYIDNCIDGRCERCKGIKEEGRDNCICLHAEENVLLIAGREAEGCTLYCTTEANKNIEKEEEAKRESNTKNDNPKGKGGEASNTKNDNSEDKIEEANRENNTKNEIENNPEDKIEDKARKEAEDKAKVGTVNGKISLIPYTPKTKRFELYPFRNMPHATHE
ncbi:6669_t:CDS:2 [Dentiscutata heterogama]|uniref:6669_t:CDS:1 n=1 Tax=Dentiscutata heterogama TaxID=1316150 RepID=A0ACA9K654_9GLOM|nr:6669_t:CDS:2 [Dentiscutata heterogama]